MHKHLLSGALALAIAVPGAAWAQAAGPIEITTYDILDKEVRTAQGDSFGTVDTVLIDTQGRVAGVIVDLRDSDRKLRLDWDRITLSDAGEVETSIDQEEVATLPEWEDDAD